MISFTQRAFYHVSPFWGKIFIFLIFIVFLFRSLNILQYRKKRKNRIINKVVPSCTKLAKSDKQSLPKLFLTTCTFLFHLSLRLPGNFETRKQSVSWDSRAFQAVLLENTSHFNKKLQNFLKPEVSPDFTDGKLLFLSCMIQANNKDFHNCCLAVS